MSDATTAPLDWRTLNLTPGGRSLIEASAGTGKTWTIAVLYLRLLLEHGLSPRQVVVTTFTDVAAQELRERLRGRLAWAVQQATVSPAGALPLDAAWLHARWATDPACLARDVAALHLALAEMDVAPISTLHGLCARVLAEHPFACGVGFAMGELVPVEAVREEVVQDAWRRLQQGDDADALVVLQRQGEPTLTLSALRDGLKVCLAPGVTVTAAAPVDLDAALPLVWAPRLRALQARDGCLVSGAKLHRVWPALADYIERRQTVPPEDSLAALEAAGRMVGILKAAQADPEVQAVAAFSATVAPLLRAVGEAARGRFWRAVAKLAREAIDTRLRGRHQLTFDAQLGRVSEALAREAATSARPLADALFAAWPVALVDEFQDTDAQQYGILDAIYRDAAGAVRGRLVMIGDPKQAIYRFRGGDIHAYRRAADQAGAADRMAIRTNYRSSRALVAALNQFYAIGGTALSTQEPHAINYVPVDASGRCDATPYTVDGVPCARPLVMHYLANPPDAVPERRARALEACANQIAGMLQSGTHELGGRPLAPSDLAVLLPTARDIDALRDQLVRRGVPCVTAGRSSVLRTDIARELQVVLYAVAHEDDLPALRAAAATRLWGDSFADLRARAQDVTLWQDTADTFRQWHVAWRERGIQSVVDALLARMAPRYLRTLGGERALTDLRHLGELLQQQAETADGDEALLAWLQAARTDDGSGDDAAETVRVRIESDAARVQLMTLHGSKGLEFPIVFLPLLWNHGERQSVKLHVVNDALSGQRRVGFSAVAREAEAQDLQDERFRVLYVALTRAIYACHVLAMLPGRGIKKGSTMRAEGTACSALDVMLERMHVPPSPKQLADMPNVAWLDDWPPRDFQSWTAHAPDVAERHARRLPPLTRDPLPMRWSFTALVHAGAESADPQAPAGDETDAALGLPSLDITAMTPILAGGDTLPEPPHPGLQALAPVRGIDIGNALHAVLERRVVGKPLTAQHALITHCLNEAGVRRRDMAQADLVDALGERLQGALDAPLGLRDAPTLCLGELPATALRAEMEFHFPLERVAMSALRAACAAHGEPDLVPVSTRILSGLMNGKIDLVFEHAGRYHVLDYKGNHLGETLADYRGEALRARMDEHHYRFQALLYTVATARYLRQRLGAAYRRECLGECVYLFVRAAGLAPQAGLWRHRFADDLLAAVDAALSHGVQEVA